MSFMHACLQNESYQYKRKSPPLMRRANDCKSMGSCPMQPAASCPVKAVVIGIIVGDRNRKNNHRAQIIA
jgi:hypothetical protein